MITGLLGRPRFWRRLWLLHFGTSTGRIIASFNRTVHRPTWRISTKRSVERIWLIFSIILCAGRTSMPWTLYMYLYTLSLGWCPFPSLWRSATSDEALESYKRLSESHRWWDGRRRDILMSSERHATAARIKIWSPHHDLQIMKFINWLGHNIRITNHGSWSHNHDSS